MRSVGHFLQETGILINQWSTVYATVMLTKSRHSALASGSLEPFHHSFDMAANVCLNQFWGTHKVRTQVIGNGGPTKSSHLMF